MNGSITIPGSPTWNYAGLNLNMTTDATMNITSSYLDDGRNRFNGVVSGNHILTLAVTGTGDATNSWCYIGGPGHWNVDGVTFNGANWNVIVQAPEIFGHTLRVNQSRLTLANASDTQTVTSLWIGGVQMTQPGTYGSSSSSADFVYDSYFGGAGVVRLVDPAAISATVGPVSPDPRTTSVSSLVFTFPAAVSNFDWTDLILSRDGGANLLNGSQSLTTSDNTTFTLNGLSSLTDKPGRYIAHPARRRLEDPERRGARARRRCRADLGDERHQRHRRQRHRSPHSQRGRSDQAGGLRGRHAIDDTHLHRRSRQPSPNCWSTASPAMTS